MQARAITLPASANGALDGGRVIGLALVLVLVLIIDPISEAALAPVG